MSSSSQRQAQPAWKILLGLLSLVMAAFIWFSGLVSSLSRPSVAPSLNLQQQEITVLAEPVVPPSLVPLVLGNGDPRMALRQSLEGTSSDQRSPRQTQLLELLSGRSVAVPADADALLTLLDCEAQGGSQSECSDPAVASTALVRLALSALLPLLTALAGTLLLVIQGWRRWRGRAETWPELRGPMLTLLDMALLVAGGFVVVSAVAVPLVVLPLVGTLTASLASPRREAVGVVINYGLMALPSLLILRRQLASCPDQERPSEGWLQWRIKPLASAVMAALSGWLRITPVVMLTGWLLVKVVGDPGGSNPLLELVLGSRDPLALALLAFTAVVLAPLFEEIIFRGALLPVLARRFGPLAGVLWSGLLFGMAHISIGELAPLTVLGVGLGLVRMSSGRLLPSVLMHGTWNAVTFLNLLLL